VHNFTQGTLYDGYYFFPNLSQNAFFSCPQPTYNVAMHLPVLQSISLDEYFGNDALAPVSHSFVVDLIIPDIDICEGIQESDVSHNLEVSQNTPNPFSQKTEISVSLHTKSTLKLKITNLTGQTILELNKGTVPDGNHNFIINGDELSPGVYFYTIFAGTESVTRKMIVK